MLIVRKIVVEDQILDALLLGTLGLLLRSHGHCKSGVGREVDGAGLSNCVNGFLTKKVRKRIAYVRTIAFLAQERELHRA